jgi:hypothetical protein
MKKLMGDKSFVLGLSFGILLIALANFYTLLPKRTGAICFDCYELWGFPFAIHESGTILHLSRFIWSGVVANILIAIVFSFLVGSSFKLIWSKFKPQSL